MKKILSKLVIILISLLVLIIVKRKLIEECLITYISKNYACDIKEIKLVLPNNIVFKDISHKYADIKVINLKVNCAGISEVQINESAVKKELIDQLKNQGSDNTSANILNTNPILKPSKILINNAKIEEVVINKLDVRLYNEFIKADANISCEGKLNKIKFNLTYGFVNKKFVCESNLYAFDKSVLLFLKGEFLGLDNILINDGNFIINESSHNFNGKLDIYNKFIDLVYKNLKVNAGISDVDKYFMNLIYDNIKLKSLIDTNKNIANFEINNLDERLVGNYENDKLIITSKRFYGIDDILCIAHDGVISVQSKIKGKSKLNAKALYKFNDDSVSFLINKIILENNYLKCLLLKESNLVIDKNGIFIKIPSFKIKSFKLDCVLNAIYKDNILSGNVNLQKVVLSDKLRFSGKLDFNNKSDNKFIFVEGALHNKDTTINISMNQIESIININFLGQNNILMKFPFVLLANNKLYKYNEDGISIKININSLIENIVKQDIVKGHLKTDLSIIFNDGKPDIKGFILFEKGIITYYRFGIIFKNFYLKALGEKNKIKIEKSSFVDLEKGHSDISGDLEVLINNIFPNIKMVFRNLCLSDDGALKLTGKGEAQVTGNITDGFLISGHVDCVKPSFKMIAYQNDYQDINVVHIYDDIKVKEKSTPLVDIIFDIDLSCSNLRIFSDMMDTIWSGNLKLCGTNDPTFIGELSSSFGTIKLFNQEFKILLGDIRFKKEFPFNPMLNLVASKNLYDLIINIKINKGVSKVIFDISSIPEKSVEDILARLIFNKESADMTPMDWAQVGYIIQKSKKGNVFNKFDDFFQTLGLSDIRLDKKNDTEKGTISIKKKFSNRFALSVENDIDDKSTFLKVQTDISDKVSMEASSRGEVGIAYKKKY